MALDGGPSVTRWVYLRVAEIVGLGFLFLVGGAVYRYVRYGNADVIYCGLIGTIGAGLFGFAQQAQVAKLNLDKSGGAATITNTTPLSNTIETKTPGETSTTPGA